MLLVVAAGTQAPLGRQRLEAGQVSIELGREEADAPHLALRHDIDAGVLLVAQREIDGVVLHLADVGGTELAAFGGRDGQVEPAGMRVRADDRRRERLGPERALRVHRQPTLMTDQPPSTVRTWPVTARDSGEMR